MNVNNFLDKEQTNTHLLIQIAKCYHKLKKQKKIYDYC